MNRVVDAIAAGRCSLALSSSILKDSEVMLALSARAALSPMALSGPTVHPILPLSDSGLARAVQQPSGVLAIVEPGPEDEAGLQSLAHLVAKGTQKPTVLVVSRDFNALKYMGLFPGLAVAQIKSKGRKFVLDLPEVKDAPALAPVAAPTHGGTAAKAAAGGDIPAPRFHFAGREEDVPALIELIKQPGAIVLFGAKGVGRTWLAERALELAAFSRVPDVILGDRVGYDTLMGRLISVTQKAGVNTLADAVRAHRKPLEQIQAAIDALKAAESLQGTALVIQNLHVVTGRAGDFFRKSRLELLVRALLTNPVPLKIVFISRVQPRFFRHEHNVAVLRFEVTGLKGRFLHEIFEVYKAPEFPRDRFGGISEAILGHPLAARTYAIEVRERENGLTLTEDPRFMKMETLEDGRAIGKALDRRLNRLTPEARAALVRLAHLRSPATGQILAELGLGRRDRLVLLSLGLLDMVGSEADRRYRVHPLVLGQLKGKELADPAIMAELGDMYARLAREAEETQRIAWAQEANRNRVGARIFNNFITLRFPDGDAYLDSAVPMMRAKDRPRFDLAERRIREVLSVDPTNSDAWLYLTELMRRANAPDAEVQAVFDEALEKAPVPEVYHELVNWHLSRRSGGMGIVVLEAAVAAMPDESRLRTRLAAMLFKENRSEEAMGHLRVAMELDPMLPDAYGLMGQAKRMEGAGAFAEAEELLREAVRLAPNDPVQGSRLVALLLDKARLQPEARAELRQEARDLLDLLISGEEPSADAFVQLAQLLREDGIDVERRGWLLDQAHKLRPNAMDRFFRYNLERAWLSLARGELDRAEAGMRQLLRREGGSYLVRVGLSEVLEAKGQLIPAFAELQAAISQLPEASLERASLELSLERLQTAIAAAMANPPAEAPMAMLVSEVVEELPALDEIPEELPVAEEDASPAF